MSPQKGLMKITLQRPLMRALLCLGLTMACAVPAQGKVAMMVCHDGGPASTEQAAPTIDAFLRHMEKTAGLNAGHLSGAYHNTGADCAAFMKSHKPALAVLDLATLLRHWDAWKPGPLAHMGPADAMRYHVVVKKNGGATDLAGLAGKTVVSTLAPDQGFLERIALGGTAPSGQLQISQTRRPLKGIRKVARGKADATVVDQEVMAHLGELNLPEELTSIYTSEGLPGLTLVEVGVNAPDKAMVKKLQGALSKLCDGDGQKLCKTFGVRGFVKANKKRYQTLAKRLR